MLNVASASSNLRSCCARNNYHGITIWVGAWVRGRVVVGGCVYRRSPGAAQLDGRRRGGGARLIAGILFHARLIAVATSDRRLSPRPRARLRLTTCNRCSRRRGASSRSWRCAARRDTPRSSSLFALQRAPAWPPGHRAHFYRKVSCRAARRTPSATRRDAS